jgi:hypothetical protein
LRKNKKMTGFFSELSGSESQLGSPSDSENEKSTKAGKPKAKRRKYQKRTIPSMVANFVTGQIGKC